MSLPRFSFPGQSASEVEKKEVFAGGNLCAGVDHPREVEGALKTYHPGVGAFRLGAEPGLGARIHGGVVQPDALQRLESTLAFQGVRHGVQ